MVRCNSLDSSFRREAGRDKRLVQHHPSHLLLDRGSDRTDFYVQCGPALAKFLGFTSSGGLNTDRMLELKGHAAKQSEFAVALGLGSWILCRHKLISCGTGFSNPSTKCACFNSW